MSFTIDNLPHIRVKATDETSESLKALAKIEDDIVFRKAVEENKGKLPLVSLIDMMGRRKWSLVWKEHIVQRGEQ